MTLPQMRAITAKAPLVVYLAPIDIDPIHGMDDRRSAPHREYKDMLQKRAKLMQGRLVVYEYDQSMLVWRDLPNPSHPAFRQDVKHYRSAGVLGVDTQSRNALATTFLNLYLRAALLWDPDADVAKLLEEFYPKFYGPAAVPMARYWGAIFRVWEVTIVTEHEYFVAPAIYTPELIAVLRKHVQEAEAAAAARAGKAKRTPDEQRILDRVRFTRLGFDVLDAYMAMVRAAATEADYKAAVTAGERGWLPARS